MHRGERKIQFQDIENILTFLYKISYTWSKDKKEDMLSEVQEAYKSNSTYDTISKTQNTITKKVYQKLKEKKTRSHIKEPPLA